MINAKKMLLPFLTRKTMATALVTAVTFLGLGAYEVTKAEVILEIDGKSKTVRTHANTVNELLNEMQVQEKKAAVYPSGNAKLKDETKVVVSNPKTITFTDKGKVTKIETTSISVRDFLNEKEIKYTKHDAIYPSLDTKIKEDIDVLIDRASNVTLNYGGETKAIVSNSNTVADFLNEQQIKLSSLDRVEPNLDSTLGSNVVVKITEVEKVSDVVEEVYPFKTVTKKDAKLAKGKKKVVSQGKNGTISRKYEVVRENGKIVSKKLVSERIIVKPVNKVIAVGTKNPSRGTTVGSEFYVEASAYSPYCKGCSGNTATGINIRSNPNAKLIAVDPRVIPLGTKVYVEGYGYAIAADTGSAIKGNKIDLLMPTENAALRWGRKVVKIRILK
ncbi:MAG: hypothetical protein K0S51_2577 [Bacillales bacterium]|nr:hypothetical protein [Bacillales bacterium]